MSARKPRFEVVRTDDGYHARFRAPNGRIVWTTEVYTTRRRCTDAISIFAWPLDACLTQVGVRSIAEKVPPVEVRNVDERTPDRSRPGLGTAGVTGAQPDEPVTQAGRPVAGGVG